jgi:hypothetical protein
VHQSVLADDVSGLVGAFELEISMVRADPSINDLDNFYRPFIEE